MARTLRSMVLDLSLDERRAELFGGLLWPAGQRDRLHLARTAGEGHLVDEVLHEAVGERVSLRPTSVFSARYTSGVGGAAYFGTYLRTLPAAKQWAALELLYSAPTGTTVLALLGNAAGQALRWTGAAWAITDPAVASNWNTEAQIVAGFPSWGGTSLRVLFRLETADESATPVVYGARAMVRLWAPSSEEELVLRTLVPHLRGLQLPVRLAVRADGTNKVNLAAIEEYRLRDDRGDSVLTVISAHDLTADPGEATELLSSWAPTTSLATLVSAPVAGHSLLLDLEVNPLVARATHVDFLEVSRLPAIVLEQLRLSPGGGADALPTRSVRDRAGGTARTVPPPERLDATVQLRVLAQYDVDLQRALAALEHPSAGSAQSEVSGEAVSLRRISDWTMQDGSITATAQWEARGLVAYRDADTGAPLLLTVTASAEDKAE